METRQNINQRIAHWKEQGYFQVVYALLFEVLVIGFVVFAGLFTLEMLLPTFIIARLSLTKFMLLLIVLLALLAWIANIGEIQFPTTPKSNHLVLFLMAFWGFGLLLISLYKFPLWSIPVLALLFLAIAFLFWIKLFSQNSA